MVVHKEYGENKHRGSWINYEDEAELTISASGEIKRYLISPNKNGNKNLFIIYELVNNANWDYCKAKKL
jgi:hypothetical protein